MKCYLCPRRAVARVGELDLCPTCWARVGKGCHACGGILLADTEDWKQPVCPSCHILLGEPENEPAPIILQHLREFRSLQRITSILLDQRAGFGSAAGLRFGVKAKGSN